MIPYFNGATAVLGGWLIGLVSLTFLVGCDVGEAEETEKVELVVYAASSLAEAFEALEERFEEEYPEIDIRLNFSGSQVLRLQIEQGAPADVFASANEEHMQVLVDGGKIQHSQLFAHNELVLIIPRANPAQIETFDDLPQASRLVIGTSEVPVGRYTRQVFARAEELYGEEFTALINANVVSEESNVRLVRAKVEMGEADAALVYRTDAMVTDDLGVVAVPEEINIRASYFMGAIDDSERQEAAETFLSYSRSPAGQQVLQAHGFIPVGQM